MQLKIQDVSELNAIFAMLKHKNSSAQGCIIAKGGTIFIQSRNLEQNLVQERSFHLTGEIVNEGTLYFEISVLTRALAKLVKLGGPCTVTFHEDTEKVTFEHEKVTLTTPTQAPLFDGVDEVFTKTESKETVTIPSNSLLHGLEQAIKFVLTGRECTNGVCFENTGHVVSTNGHVLRRVHIPALSALEEFITVPTGTVQALIYALKKMKPEGVCLRRTEVGSGYNLVTFDFENVSLVAECVKATFPDYRFILRSERTRDIHVRLQPLQKSLDLVVMAKADRVKISVDTDSMELECKDSNSVATSSTECDLTGGPFEFYLNPTYFQEILEGFTSDHIHINCGNDALETVVFTEDGSISDEDFSGVLIAPIRGQ
jgi:DNA polymerase III sliding clamp (beta) subunit (PCNA family)